LSAGRGGRHRPDADARVVYRRGTVQRWLVDAHNVIGARPDGWWRDRDGAARRLVAAVRTWAAGAGADVLVVLDAGPPELAGEAGPGVEVAIAPTRGRDAGDDELVRRLAAEPDPAAARVVTSDAALAARARALGATVEGAGSFRRRLEAAGG
jgi:predicted RNA-binding protein with PIN domain